MERIEVPASQLIHQTSEAIKIIERHRKEYIAEMRSMGFDITEIHDETVLTPPEKETEK